MPGLTTLDLLQPCNSDTIKSRQCQKANYDTNTRPIKFRAGDLVGYAISEGKDGCQEQYWKCS